MNVRHPDEPNATMQEILDDSVAELQKDLVFRSHTTESLYKQGYLEGYIEQLAIDLHEESGYVNYPEAEKGAKAKVLAMTIEDLWDNTEQPVDWSRVLEDLR